MNKFNLAWILVFVLLLSSSVDARPTSYVQANGLVAKINESGTYYYHSNHLGSTSAITDNGGKVMEEQVNLPFGELIEGSERYGFTGKESDHDLGLSYFGARYYNPATGRFLSVDPVRDGVNWFSYVSNNPLQLIDPTGNKEEYPLVGARRIIGGDMLEYKDKNDVPFYIHIDENKQETSRIIKKGKNTDYKTRLTNAYLMKWFLGFNECFKYLSGGEFSMKLMGISRREHERPDFIKRKGFKMEIDPTLIGGYYNKRGHFVVGADSMTSASDPIYLTFTWDEYNGDTWVEKKMTIRAKIGTPIHEVFHGFFGGEHPERKYWDKSITVPWDGSTLVSGMAEDRMHTLGLLTGEADYLGWPHVRAYNIVEFLTEFEKGIRFLTIGEKK